MKNLKVVAVAAAAMAGALLVSPTYAEVDVIGVVDAGNGGLKAGNGVSGTSIITERTTIADPFLLPDPKDINGTFLGEVPLNQDFQQSGFNKQTGYYEFKYTLDQAATIPAFEGIGKAIIGGVIRYSLADKKGYLMSISCQNVSGPQICGFVNGSNGLVRNVDIMTAAEIETKFGAGVTFESLTEPQLNAINAGVGVMIFDEANPLKFDVKVKDIVQSVLTTSFEMRSVPVPAAAWLFGSAMLGLLGLKKAKVKTKK